ncbi:LysE family translocator [Klebsiella quasipneumoniae]|uniref:LysE family translocator n=1 Tax=Klebsiella quasipneumoniae TaxID=1463165 RepID=UPI001CE1578C|nr:LysE family translocator [Klebsiella quasipneumoniae]MCA5546664.1 LysE family translocator [Klebsiella pneumoniae]MCB3391577.1 LysE family translocator [Klebsiella quasipneumoniae]MCB3415053.1 LysE family translocator [Klebsiella quasipneumoniae]MCH9291450.1 LysE family translocator [Klebsiella quasipneumoniae]HBT5241863.1 LysE family translocator [Klebsiella quasipneumoniae]
MSAATLLSFWFFSLMFVMTPGADWAYAITAGIRGRQVPAVTGLVFGYVVLTIVVAAGIGPLVAGNTAAMTLLTVMGALYLAWLGIGMLRHPPAPIAVGEEVGQISWRSAAMKGALVSGLNPKAFMFFLAFLPPFTVSDAAWQIPTQLFTLGMVYTVSCSVVYMLVGYGASIVLSTRPAAACFVGRVSGIIMLLLGAFLLYRQLSHY